MTLEPQQLLTMYRLMATIRAFDNRAVEEFHAGNIPGVVHAYLGQEAIAVGVCTALRRDDKIVSTHRGHGHTIAKGADLKRMMAELFGRSNGYCHGKGGSMHIADFSVGMLGANGIVGAGMPIATGAALAAKLAKSDGVAVAFFGDGASNEGSFHSSLNLASIWKLPAIFVCENNHWAVAVPASYALSVSEVSARASAYNIPGVTVDGTDVLAVYEAAAQAVQRARRGGTNLAGVHDAPLAHPLRTTRQSRRSAPARSAGGSPAARSHHRVWRQVAGARCRHGGNTRPGRS